MDTNISFVMKLSPDGEVLWHKSLFPMQFNSQIYNRYDMRYQMHFDNQQNLIIAGALWDTTGFIQNSHLLRKLFYKKWDNNGNQLYEKLIMLDNPPYNQASNGFLSDMKLRPNGDIYLSHYFSDNMSCYAQIYGVNQNFDSIFSVNLHIPDTLNTYAGEAPLLALNDTALTVAYSKRSYFPFGSKYHYLLQYSLATADTNWIKVRGETGDYYSVRQIEMYNNYIYIAASGMEKYNMYGDSVLFNRNQQITQFVIDTGSGKLFGNCFCVQDNIGIHQFDTSLNIVNSIIPPALPGMLRRNTGIAIQDSFLLTLHYTADSNDANRFTSIDYTKRNLYGNTVQVATLKIDQPIYEVLVLKNIVLDFRKDLIILASANFYPLPDTGNVTLYSHPIMAAKISFDTNFNLSGKIFVDHNANCQIDSNEAGIENNLVRMLPEDIYTFSDSTGDYSFKKANGTANIEYVPFINGMSNCVANGTHTITVMNNALIDTLHFGMHPDSIFHDARGQLYCGISRPGFIQRTNLQFQNVGTEKLYHVQAVLTLDSFYTLQNALWPPDSIVGNQLFWNVDSMSIGKIVNIFADLQTNVAVNLGYQYHHTLYITADGDTISTLNNVDTAAGIVIGSFDPNHKLATPEGIGPENCIDNNEMLHYMIEFQNTGTDTAFNVRLIDDLDQNLDISTLTIKGASHKMHYTLQNRKISFFYDNILLPDSNKNYQQSIGFVTYSIKPRANSLGKKILNKASIYFDFNAPIITNTTSHTIGLNCYAIDFEKDQLAAYPIPFGNNKLQLDIHVVSSGNISLEIYDISGRKVKTLFNGYAEKGQYHFELDERQIHANQIYLVSLTTVNSKKSIRIVR